MVPNQKSIHFFKLKALLKSVCRDINAFYLSYTSRKSSMEDIIMNEVFELKESDSEWVDWSSLLHLLSKKEKELAYLVKLIIKN